MFRVDGDGEGRIPQPATRALPPKAFDVRHRLGVIDHEHRGGDQDVIYQSEQGVNGSLKRLRKVINNCWIKYTFGRRGRGGSPQKSYVGS